MEIALLVVTPNRVSILEQGWIEFKPAHKLVMNLHVLITRSMNVDFFKLKLTLQKQLFTTG